MKKKLILLLVSIFTIFGIYTEAKNMDNLTQREKDIAAIASLTAAGNTEKLAGVINNSLDNGLSVNELKEVLVQMYAYAGFPRSLNGINTAVTVIADRELKGMNDNIGPEPKIVPTENKFVVGKANIERLFGKSDNTPAYETFTPAINTFLKEHLFCDIFERGILSDKDREIATVAALASIKGLNPQLTAHMMGAMNVGVSENQCREIIEVVRENINDEQADNAQQILKGILKNKK